MNIFNKTWIPTEEEKALAEKYIWPFVSLLRQLTAWHIVFIWSFLFPFFAGQGLIYCICISLFCAIISWNVWAD